MYASQKVSLRVLPSMILTDNSDQSIKQHSKRHVPTQVPYRASNTNKQKLLQKNSTNSYFTGQDIVSFTAVLCIETQRSSSSVA